MWTYSGADRREVKGGKNEKLGRETLFLFGKFWKMKYQLNYHMLLLGYQGAGYFTIFTIFHTMEFTALDAIVVVILVVTLKSHCDS